ncbi:alpha-1B-glycoprotein-like isoform X2 [Pelodiscus sinensis]|uniref:alpha-1B-glycoprotein-like isoform X2 n=1 Tax=Pelodiscus sinensis TaxID=13735 RepID=UPI000703D2E6|nr:alpha-1B-glycoprotein-like isoform X2 [Pelodiscus sinensis]|eukprot:XP_014429032.1 alpha-1B-glycoprotein-like isoform X2 [Pelodiscus sinensis]
MVLRLLLALAALQMFPSPVSPSARLSAPKLSLHPLLRQFVEGEQLTLRCSARGAEGVTSFEFFDPSGGKPLSMKPHKAYREAWLHLTANQSTAGEYSCAYRREVSGKEAPSEKSSSVYIRVLDAPQAPSLSVHPQYKEYRPGTSVDLACSAPPLADNIKGFQYFGDRIAISALASFRRNYTYQLSITGPEVSGLFTCSYWVRMLGRNIPSKRSEPVDIYVKNSTRIATRRSRRAKAEKEPIYMSIDPDVLLSPNEPSTPPDSVSPADQQDI